MKLKPTQRVKGTALVTGGARRIGGAICLHLATIGYHIELHYDHSKKEAQKLAQTIEQRGGTCQIFNCDLSDEKATHQLIKGIYKRCPDLNMLINSASIFKPSDLSHDPLRAFNEHMAVNLKAPYILTCEFAKHVKTGQIINILDTNIVKNKTSHVAYLLSKKALNEFTKLSAVELAPRIRVNGIAPGFILPPEGKNKINTARKIRNIPLQTQGNVEQITECIEFLIKNPYLTGQIIFNDGGEHLL